MTVSDHRPFVRGGYGEEIRRLYATGLYSQSEIARQVGCTRHTVARYLDGEPPVPGVRLPKDVPPPAGHQPLPVVLLSQRVRGWWPGIPRTCPACGGREIVTPARHEDGYVSCLLCDREVAVVKREVF